MTTKVDKHGVIFSENAIKPSSPPTGKRRVYAKDDGLLYYLAPDGTERPIGGKQESVPAVPDTLVLRGEDAEIYAKRGMFGEGLEKEIGYYWESRDNGGGSLLSIVYTKLGRLVVVGTGSDVWVSDDDGDTWSTRPNAANLTWRDIIQTDTDRLVAVATNGTLTNNIMVSDNDGETWTSKTGAIEEAQHRLIQTNTGRLVSISSTATNLFGIQISDNDGENWEARQVPVANTWRDITSTPSGRLVAVASSGDGDRIMTSDDDAESWTIRYITGVGSDDWMNNNWQSVIALPSGRFVAIADTGNDNQVITSDDGGVNWEPRSTGISIPWRRLIRTQSGRIVAIGGAAEGEALVMISDDDGESWIHKPSATASTWVSVVETESGRLVAVAYDGLNERVMISDSLSDGNVFEDKIFAMGPLTFVGGDAESNRVQFGEEIGIHRPRQMADADAPYGLIFYSTDDNRLKYRDPSGALYNLT
jgi:hypothetical protein